VILLQGNKENRQEALLWLTTAVTQLSSPAPEVVTKKFSKLLEAGISTRNDWRRTFRLQFLQLACEHAPEKVEFRAPPWVLQQQCPRSFYFFTLTHRDLFFLLSQVAATLLTEPKIFRAFFANKGEVSATHCQYLASTPALFI
jgi:hypothetical protein